MQGYSHALQHIGSRLQSTTSTLGSSACSVCASSCQISPPFACSSFPTNATSTGFSASNFGSSLCRRAKTSPLPALSPRRLLRQHDEGPNSLSGSWRWLLSHRPFVEHNQVDSNPCCTRPRPWLPPGTTGTKGLGHGLPLAAAFCRDVGGARSGATLGLVVDRLLPSLGGSVCTQRPTVGRIILGVLSAYLHLCNCPRRLANCLVSTTQVSAVSLARVDGCHPFRLFVDINVGG